MMHTTTTTTRLANALTIVQSLCADRQNIARDKAAVDNCAERSMHRVSHTSKRTVDNKTKNMAFFLNRSSEVKNLTTYLQLAVVKADPYLKTIANIIHGDASDPSLKTVIDSYEQRRHARP
jgi:hypothetical protein